jgi:uncharacterized protein with HEPN domain
MTRHDDDVSLRQMRDHAREAVESARGKTRADLDRDRQFELALTRLVEIIGEAATRVSPATRAKHPAVPWPEILGLRNRIVHGYDKINLDILWQVVTDDLPPLIVQLEAALAG